MARYTDRLFMDILVPLSGYEESWDALDQAIIIAQRENASLHGLHVVDANEDLESSDAQGVKRRFDRTCKTAGVTGSLAIVVGDITQRIIERAVAADLILLKVANAPAAGVSSVMSPFRAIIQNSSRPLIAVPGKATLFQRALLAYDGGPRSKEALFVATYLAEMWKTELIVFTALQGGKINADIQDNVRRYLDIHEVQADYIVTEGDSLASLKKVVEERQTDFVLMGGYGGSVIKNMFIGSSVDYMLRESKTPTFICR